MQAAPRPAHSPTDLHRPTIRFRNYVPRDASLVDAQTGVATVAPPRPAPSVVVAAEEAQELARLVASDVRLVGALCHGRADSKHAG